MTVGGYKMFFSFLALKRTLADPVSKIRVKERTVDIYIIQDKFFLDRCSVLFIRISMERDNN